MFLASETEQNYYIDEGEVTRYHIPRTNELSIKLNVIKCTNYICNRYAIV